MPNLQFYDQQKVLLLLKPHNCIANLFMVNKRREVQLGTRNIHFDCHYQQARHQSSPRLIFKTSQQLLNLCTCIYFMPTHGLDRGYLLHSYHLLTDSIDFDRLIECAKKSTVCLDGRCTCASNTLLPCADCVVTADNSSFIVDCHTIKGSITA